MSTRRLRTSVWYLFLLLATAAFASDVTVATADNPAGNDVITSSAPAHGAQMNAVAKTDAASRYFKPSKSVTIIINNSTAVPALSPLPLAGLALAFAAIALGVMRKV